MIKLEQ